ncbi:hypothetical protein NQ318_001818 [Aromia moschata]|uniref:ZAD domain-containing protein n=1 Tax=Aromia moschata TaxID=1265417 RepID=A0AAV8Z2F4_9CUCU|nr:hypothetical protein NQ318_001818 [Aromia moschata]
MEDNKVVVCRLCLNIMSSEDAEEIDPITRNLLQVLIPDLNLDVTLDPKICRTCNKTALASFEFNSACNKKLLHTEVKVKDEHDYVKIGGNLKQCDFCCSSSVDKSMLKQLEEQKSLFTKALEKCLPDWSLLKGDTSHPCTKCWKIITDQFSFLKSCLDKERQIENYVASRGKARDDKVNLYEVLQFVLGNKTKPILPDLCIKTDRKEEDDSGLWIKTEHIEIKSEDDVTETYNVVSSKSRSPELEQMPTSLRTWQVPKNKVLYDPTLYLTAAKQPKTEPEREWKEKPNTRSVGVQVNVRDLVEHFSVGIQVDCLELEMKSVGVEVKPSMSDKQVSCRPRSQHASVLTKGAVSREKRKVMRRKIKTKK